MTHLTRSQVLDRARERFDERIVAFIEQHLRPAVAIALDGDGQAEQTAAGRSRFGGLPDLAADETWPTFNGPGQFVGQIDFAELPAQIREHHELPATGLLRIFTPVPDDQDDFFWGDPGFVKTLFTTAPVTAADWPAELEGEYRPDPQPVRFEFAWSLPTQEPLVAEWPIDDPDFDEPCPIATFAEELCPVEHLFGHTDFTSLYYDPTPEGHIPFLTLSSLEELDWCWNDGDFLQVFITPDALAAGDFSSLRSDAG